MKISCHCGALIVDNTDDQPHNGDLIPDQEWFATYDALDDEVIDPIAAGLLKPTTPLRYTEPESHLDHVAGLISNLPYIDPDSHFRGITLKDQSTIDRLVKLGFRNARVLDATADLGITDHCAGVETIQQRISQGVLRTRSANANRYDVVILRHILEHVHALDRFVSEVRSLITPNGYLVIEVPDFTASLSAGDYSTLWE